jgi:transcriptional/translational regulatory protein YebC/TACO1
LGATNCVAYLFERKGLFNIPVANTDEDRLMEITLDAGADDIRREGEYFQVTCPPDSFTAVQQSLEAANIEPESKEITRIPSSTVEIADLDTAKSVLKLIEALDDHDDVQNVSSNFTIPDEAMAALSAG